MPTAGRLLHLLHHPFSRETKIVYFPQTGSFTLRKVRAMLGRLPAGLSLLIFYVLTFPSASHAKIIFRFIRTRRPRGMAVGQMPGKLLTSLCFFPEFVTGREKSLFFCNCAYNPLVQWATEKSQPFEGEAMACSGAVFVSLNRTDY